jgi:hypothetical protein
VRMLTKDFKSNLPPISHPSQDRSLSKIWTNPDFKKTRDGHNPIQVLESCEINISETIFLHFLRASLIISLVECVLDEYQHYAQ